MRPISSTTMTVFEFYTHTQGHWIFIYASTYASTHVTTLRMYTRAHMHNLNFYIQQYKRCVLIECSICHQRKKNENEKRIEPAAIAAERFVRRTGRRRSMLLSLGTHADRLCARGFLQNAKIVDRQFGIMK